MSAPIRESTRRSVERALQEMDWHPSDNLKRLLLEAVQRVLDDPGPSAVHQAIARAAREGRL